MKQLAIKADNISKQYRLGEVGTGTLSHDLNRFWHKVRGKEDPYLRVGEVNDRANKGESDYVWSLRDINFEIEQGQAVGIIGRNGAGKSTLLKLLSKVTKPTTGSFKVNGRIASLLEVGTGFNPDMTGRENIYLNGAILGMRRAEITRKLDEIIAFSGVERYIDTPVKRYSSGMYVRLAFAVAAHLESEILIVDEVLAVGDSEFQKKCLGKMGEVSKGEGRTVLFVSHNMGAITNLCSTSILLDKGQLLAQGKSVDIINKSIQNNFIRNQTSSEKIKLVLQDTCITNIAFNDQINKHVEVRQGEKLVFSFEVDKKESQSNSLFFNIEFKTFDGISVGSFGNEFQEFDIKINQGKSRVEVDLGEIGWKQGDYFMNLYFQIGKGGYSSKYEVDAIFLSVVNNIIKSKLWTQYITKPQHGNIPIKWDTIKVSEIK
jgi:lipopolysaccharide transport system ATP-binding protein